MSKGKGYAATKGQFVQKMMNDGATKNQINNAWHKSEQKASFNNNGDSDDDGSDIDRSYDSPWQDWAETSDDL
jgi:hypothetical protein